MGQSFRILRKTSDFFLVSWGGDLVGMETCRLQVGFTNDSSSLSGAALPPQLLPHLGVPRSPATQVRGDTDDTWGVDD